MSRCYSAATHDGYSVVSKKENGARQVNVLGYSPWLVRWYSAGPVLPRGPLSSLDRSVSRSESEPDPSVSERLSEFEKLPARLDTCCPSPSPLSSSLSSGCIARNTSELQSASSCTS